MFNSANEESVEGNNIHHNPAFYSSISKARGQMQSVQLQQANNKDLAASSIYSSSQKERQ